MTIQELVDTLKATLSAELGEYTLGNGSVVPAINVLALGKERDARIEVRGLEVVVAQLPASSNPRRFLGGELNYKDMRSIYLTQYPDAGDEFGAAINTAWDKLQAEFGEFVRGAASEPREPAMAQYACLLRDYGDTETETLK